MGRPITTRDRLRYRFDATLSRGTIGVIAWLAAVTVVVVLIAGFAVWLLGVRTGGEHETGFIEGTWLNLMHAIDAGALGGDSGWTWRIIALVVTVAGIFVLSILIGIISSGIETRLDELRKGRSLVVEHGHTLILGWSPKLHQILAELDIANENQRDPCVVLLADRDKVEMEDEVRARANHGRRTRVICRSGSPSDPSDLEFVRPEDARSILILLDESTGDPGVVKTVLALLSIDPDLAHLRVTAEFESEDSAAAIDRATNGKMGIVVSSDVIARVTAQVCRQSGLSVVFQELLDFDGDEVYFQEEPGLVGAAFGDALTAYDHSAVIGVRDAGGTVTLSPPLGRVFEPGDQVIAISADDDTIRLSGEVVRVSDMPSTSQPAIVPVQESTLLIGWNALAPTILGELDRYVSAGSTVRLLVDPTQVEEPVELPELANTAIDVVEMDTVDGAQLTAQVNRDRYDQVIILCYRTGDAAADDARALLTLLQVRQATQLDGPNASVRLVTELLDVRDVDLARVANPDDFVVSERLTSLMLAQLSENNELRGVFADLFDAEGVELVLVPADRYDLGGAEATFGDVVVAARDRGHVAVGVRIVSTAVEGGLGGGGVLVNPAKSRTISFGDGDQILVLA
ncbi:MAG: CASTOR/POLLUX-related putative ion channel [Gaiellales bacterium]